MYVLLKNRAKLQLNLPPLQKIFSLAPISCSTVGRTIIIIIILVYCSHLHSPSLSLSISHSVSFSQCTKTFICVYTVHKSQSFKLFSLAVSLYFCFCCSKPHMYLKYKIKKYFYIYNNIILLLNIFNRNGRKKNKWNE